MKSESDKLEKQTKYLTQKNQDPPEQIPIEVFIGKQTELKCTMQFTKFAYRNLYSCIFSSMAP